MKLSYAVIIAVVLVVISIIYIFGVTGNVFDLSCYMKLWMNSNIKIGLKNFLGGIPLFVANSLGGLFGANTASIHDGWSTCIFSYEDTETLSIADDWSKDALNCWNMFGAGEKDYLEGESPIIDCFKKVYEFSLGKNPFIGIIAQAITGSAQIDSEVLDNFESSKIKMIFIKYNEGLDEAEFVDLGDLDNTLNDYAVVSISFFDWQTFTSFGYESEMKTSCYVPYSERESIAQTNSQITDPINALTPLLDWEKTGICEVCETNQGVETCTNHFVDGPADCAGSSSTYNVPIDGLCDLAYSSCGFLRKSMTCCEDKIVVCISGTDTATI